MDIEDEEEMTALRMIQDLDKMERDQEKAGYSARLKFHEEHSPVDNSLPNTNNRSNPTHKSGLATDKKPSNGKQGKQINVEPIVHVQQDNGSLSNASGANDLLASENKTEPTTVTGEPMPGTSGVLNHDHHGSPSTSNGDRGVEVAVVRMSNI